VAVAECVRVRGRTEDLCGCQVCRHFTRPQVISAGGTSLPSWVAPLKRRFEPLAPHFLGLLREAISAGDRIGSPPLSPAHQKPIPLGALDPSQRDGLRKDQAVAFGRQPPPAIYRLDDR
jgi:hypothetical protein